MHIPHRVSRRRALRLVTALAAIAGIAAAPLLTGSATAATRQSTSGTVIDEISGVYGPMLAVGSGPYAGQTLYMITSDYGTSYGCTTTKYTVLGGPYVCTGPSNDQNAEWPALTTTGAPVAGPGVKQSLLGVVNRAGVGEQVTYNGHPLYLFEPVPFLVTGEGWDEPSLPPDHGVWWLVSPAGNPVGWENTVTTVTINGEKRLAVFMTDGGGTVAIPVYSYSAGTACTGTCSALWSPVYNQGTPAVAPGVGASEGGQVTRADGTTQLTWAGKPLYVYGDEAISIGASGFVVAGNGNDRDAPAPAAGMFSLVTP